MKEFIFQEKLLKDKARFMQHRLSMPDFDNSVNVGSKEGRNKDKKGEYIKKRVEKSLILSSMVFGPLNYGLIVTFFPIMH